jgi:hypothetical protein
LISRFIDLIEMFVKNITAKWKMKEGSELKNNIKHRLMNAMSKPKQEKRKVRSKSPVQKFSYQLPSSFFQAVDNARIESGDDVLPHFHHLSVSSQSSSSVHQPNKHHHHHHHKQRKVVHSSSTSDNNKVPQKKRPLRQAAKP